MKLISNKQIIVLELAYQAFKMLKLFLTKEQTQEKLEDFFTKTLSHCEQHADMMEALKMRYVMHYQYRVCMTDTVCVCLTNTLEDKGIELVFRLSEEASVLDEAGVGVLRDIFEPRTVVRVDAEQSCL